MKTVELRVHGLVQGVGFRWATYTLAKKLKIMGFVKNEPDGTVLIQASGQNSQLAKFMEQVGNSPTPAGSVSKMETKLLDDQGFTHFEIRH